MEKIKVGEEEVYLNKSKLGKWGVVYPIKTNGKLNWKNLLAGGSWWNWVKIAIIVAIVLGCVYEYSATLTMLNKCLELNSFQLGPWNI